MMKGEEKLVLAALLHDIGKFFWRTGAGKDWPHEVMSAFTAEALLPDHLKEDIPSLIAWHHTRDPEKKRKWLRPPEDLLKALCFADWSASGEREEPEEEKREQPPYLISIISETFKEEAKVPPHWHHLKILELKEDVLFPIPSPPWGETYDSLWRSFRKEFSKFKRSKQSFHLFIPTLLSFLQKFTWCMPSAVFKAVPDVPLFEHLKLTAALAPAILRSINPSQIPLNKKQWIDLNSPVCSLIFGDICGIQSFIQTISPRGVALALKGRSTFLRLLSDACTRWLLRELELFPPNVIFCSGGHFLIISHFLNDNRFNEIRQKFEKEIYDAWGGEIYVALAKIDLKPADFFMPEDPAKQHPLAKKIEYLTEKGIPQAKSKKNFSFLKEVLQMPDKKGGEEEKGFCRICRSERNLLTSKILTERYEIEKERAEVCQFCEDLMDLAIRARNAKYLLIMPKEANKGIEILGHKYLFPEEAKEIEEVESPWIIQVRINNTDFLPSQMHQNRAYTFDFFNVLAPEKKGKILTFDEIAQMAKRKEKIKEAESEWGVKRLGAIKLDGDNMGDIFRKGLGQKLTLGRFAALSFCIKIFFEGFTEILAEREKGIYTIYSGGDDLFFVGPWNSILNLSLRIKEAYSEYACKHPNYTISGGVLICDPHHPLYLMLQDLNFYLDTAKGKRAFIVPLKSRNHNRQKEHKRNKNSLALFESCWGWNEIEEAKNWKDRFLASWRVYPEEIRPLLMIIRRAFEEWRSQGAEDFIGRWCWFVAWQCARRKSSDPKKLPLNSLLDDIQNSVQNGKIKVLGLAARWAEFETRRWEDEERGDKGSYKGWRSGEDREDR